MHTHLGEGENEGMMARWGKRTMDWCGEMGFIGEDVWYAHDWEVTKEEYRVLAATGTGVSHCPAPAVTWRLPDSKYKGNAGSGHPCEPGMRRFRHQ